MLRRFIKAIRYTTWRFTHFCHTTETRFTFILKKYRLNAYLDISQETKILICYFWMVLELK